MIFKVLAILIATLSGSVHCGAMCGGLSLTVGPNAALQVRYQFARLFSYLIIGFLSGILGSKIAPPESVHRMALIAGGVVSLYLIASGFRLFWSGRPLEGAGDFFGLFRGFQEKAIQVQDPGVRAWVFGGLTPFLPCGWIFTALLLSLNSGSSIFGMFVFFAVWLGSLPILIAGPSLLRLGLRRFGARGRKWIAIAMVCAGFFSLFERFQVFEFSDSGHVQSELICH